MAEPRSMSFSVGAESSPGSAFLEARGISKSYPGVQALSGVDFSLRAGEVHALCGENGAGKSTLARILAGSEIPDAGTLRLAGSIVSFRKPLDAKRAGVLLIHQELSLIPELSVAENIYLGSLPRLRLCRVDYRKLFANAEALLSEFQCGVKATDIVEDLSIAKRQLVEIARAAAFKCSVAIFDEPTASLSDEEARVLFACIANLKAAGAGVIYISHKMAEIFRLSDRITVLRDGALRDTLSTQDTDEDAVTRLMIGRAVERSRDSLTPQRGEEILRVERFSVPGFVDDASFSVHKSEVVGLYGLVGAGRSELVEAIFGVRKKSPGSEIYWLNALRAIPNSRCAMELGIGLIPEDRKRQGLVLGMDVAQNVTLPLIDLLQTMGFLKRRREEAVYDRYRARLSIKASTSHEKALNLSGGNQQKIVIAKWLATEAKLLILDEPTRGIDVGAKAEIHRLIAELAALGMAILVISSEMQEIIAVSHRILAMYKGRFVGDFSGGERSERNLIAAVTGHTWSGPVEGVGLS
jgi:ribose transport system ATP-binding protein